MYEMDVSVVASLLLLDVYEMDVHKMDVCLGVCVFDACVCEGLARSVVVVVQLFASLRRCCYWMRMRC